MYTAQGASPTALPEMICSDGPQKGAADPITVSITSFPVEASPSIVFSEPLEPLTVSDQSKEMNKHQKSWRRAAASLTAVAVTTAGLFWAGPAAAQGHTRITEDDLPGGDTGCGGGGGLIHTTIEYVTNNTYLSICPHYLDYTGSSSNLVVENPTGISVQVFAVGQELENTGAGLGSKTFAGGTLGLYVPWTGHHLAAEVLLAAPLEVTFETTGRAIDESLAIQTRTGIKTGCCWSAAPSAR